MDIVGKYAHAYLNVFGHQLNQKDIERLHEAAQFLDSHRRALFLLKVPLISVKIKHKGLHEFCKRFALRESVIRLINLLLRDKRAFLLAKIFYAIVDIFREKHHIHTFMISSSAQLNETQQSDIERFLAGHVEGTIIYKYRIDKNLIAGIRLQSETLLWERSINKQLNDIWRSRMH